MSNRKDVGWRGIWEGVILHVCDGSSGKESICKKESGSPIIHENNRAARSFAERARESAMKTMKLKDASPLEGKL